MPELTQRQKQVMELLIQGKRDREIGEILGISWRTAKHHVESACNTLGALTRTEAVAMFIERQN